MYRHLWLATSIDEAILLVFPLTGRPLRFDVTLNVCLLLGDVSELHAGCEHPVHSWTESLRSFQRTEERSGDWYLSYTNTSSFSSSECIVLTRVYTFHADRHSLWTHCKYSPKEHAYHMHINFPQLVTVKQSWTSVTHHLFPSTSCFCAISAIPIAAVHEYMLIYETHYASDVPLV